MILKKSSDNTADEISITKKQSKDIQHQTFIITQNIMSLHAEVKELYKTYLNKISDHQTIDKKKKGLYKHALQIKTKIQEQDSELVNLTNEIARVKIDQLNTKAEIERLEKKQKEVQKE